MVFHFQGLYRKQEFDLEMLTLWETLRKMVLHMSHAGKDLGLPAVPEEFWDIRCDLAGVPGCQQGPVPCT